MAEVGEMGSTAIGDETDDINLLFLGEDGAGIGGTGCGRRGCVAGRTSTDRGTTIVLGADCMGCVDGLAHSKTGVSEMGASTECGETSGGKSSLKEGGADIGGASCE
jgi:hypothetical protein